ncbi:MAG: DUF2237 domain-containing protein [Arenicellales bacterium]|jgi:uncharacterized protein (DUF2237 family)
MGTMQERDKDQSLNVYGEPLESCSEEPITGFFRDGKCNTCREDLGSHTICVKVNSDFLEFSRSRGNDLSTPMPQFGFAGLKPGDSWCLCAARWLQAYEHDMAPRVHMTRTHIRALEIVALEQLKEYAADLN